MRRRLPEGVGPGALVGAAVVALRLLEGARYGRWGHAPAPLAEVAGWLPWQLQDNLRHGRLPFDASVFADGTASLWPITGNPGGAVLAAPVVALFGAAGGSVLVPLLGVFLNAVAGGVYGATHRVPWIGALAASASWWAVGFTQGTGAQVLLAPGLLAAAWVGGSSRRGAAVALLGALIAPLPTGAALLAAGELPLGAAALLGLLLPPLGTWGGEAWRGSDLAWFAGGAARALPLAALLALAGLLRGAGGARVAAAAAVLALVAGFHPAALAGFEVTLTGVASSAPAAAALTILLVAGVRLAGQTAHAQARAALVGLLALDVAGPILAGGGGLWHATRPLPAALEALADTPRSATVHVVPAAANPAAGVGLLPYHRQLVGRAPTLSSTASDTPEMNPEQVLFTLRRENPRMVLVLTTEDTVQRSAWATKLGPPRELREDMALWAWP